MRDGKQHVVRALGQMRLTAAEPACQCSETVSRPKSTEKVYRRLVYNLEILLAEIGRRKIPVDFFTVHPGVASLRGRDSEITRLLDRARTAGITVKVQKGV